MGVCPWFSNSRLSLDQKGTKTIPFWAAHNELAYIRGVLPGRKSKCLKNSVHGPGCPLNALFGQDPWERKELV